MSADGPGGETLGEKIAVLRTEMTEARKDISELQTDVSGLKRFQAWVFGVGSGVGAIAAFMAQSLKDRLGLG